MASWLILQVVATLEAPLALPEWFDTVVVVLLAIGLPIAILFAWAFELTPDGIRSTQPKAAGENPPLASNTLDYVLIAALLVVGSAIVWDQVGKPSLVGGAASSSLPQNKSIAVLPFVDMSPQGDQEYFGDGIAEELLNELSRLDGLRVASRTSSFAFKSTQKDIRAIGEALNVSLVLEGSVRKEGGKVRITAQLIDAADGYHHWSQTYNRDLADIFAIQDDIAKSIAGMLGVSLGVGNVNSFSGAGTDSIEAYEAFLRTQQIPSRDDRIRALQDVIEIDPDYAAALADLGILIASTMWTHPPEDAPGILDRALPILYRAIEIRPDSAYAHSLLATVNYAAFDWITSEQHYELALGFARDGGTLGHYGNMLMRSGRSTAALRAYDEALAAERYAVEVYPLMINAYLALGKLAESAEMVSQFPGNEYFDFLVGLNQGDASAIKAALKAFPDNVDESYEDGLSLLQIFESPDRSLELLESLYADQNNIWPAKYHDIALMAAYFGDPEFALEVFSNEVRRTTIRFGALWYPVMSEVRKLPEFKALVADVNLVEYWRNHGWSDHCQPLGDDDFGCF